MRANTQNFTSSFYLEYRDPNEKGSTLLKFLVNNQNDLNYLKQLQYLVNFTKCIQDTYLNTNSFRITSKFRKILITLVNNRLGKSIFTTELCTAINVHGASIPNNRFANVPIDFGYTSHFRSGDLIVEAHGMSHPISVLKFDIEYLFFLVRNANHFKNQ
jgi:hypothetical protein